MKTPTLAIRRFFLASLLFAEIVWTFQALSSHPTWTKSCSRRQLTTQQRFKLSSWTNTEDNSNNIISIVNDRRSFLHSVTTTVLATGGGLLSLPQTALAGIDVSGLPVEGGIGGGGGNPNLVQQLKAYDGSGTARVREIKSMSTMTTGGESSPTIPSTAASTSSSPGNDNNNNDNRSPIATWAYRYNPGVGATLTRTGTFGNLYRYSDNLEAPSNSKRRSIGVQFEFPADWLQLDRSVGGIQYVDQRNGDKLYVFRAPLPKGNDDSSTTSTTTYDLTTLPKNYIAEAIFSPNGSFVQSGQTVQDYSVSRAQVLSDCPTGMCAPHRRFKLKFSTVTGNGLQVERRGLVDAYQVDQDIYMIMTSSNAAKFEQKDSRERETVENIVNSFIIDV
ncbi:hypothetical protein IV203_007842 [Nitzschia inconspicua]|uniref:Uncharacterized protein n=1 Tax=Nitzschia inconspicua TaxID=303405 RepID=A0A9K3PNT3_9STRA|nr:hypothetical protein IV203_007842 [Nitzschia inconspicua]